MTREADRLPKGDEGVRFVVHGRVQGVGFRWWTHREAERLGVAGTVRNLADGTVEVLAFGSPDQIERLQRGLWRGPPLSEVERIERRSTAPNPALHEFRIVD